MLRLCRASPLVIATSTGRPINTERDVVLHNLVSAQSSTHPHCAYTLTQQDRRRERDDRDRRERRRSRSPAAIDRYQPDRLPRDDYYRRYDDRNDRRDRRRSSPDRMGAGTIDRYVPNQSEPAAPLVNPLPDPMKLEFQVGFTWFAEWWRAEQRVKEEKEFAKQGRRAPLKGER